MGAGSGAAPVKAPAREHGIDFDLNFIGEDTATGDRLFDAGCTRRPCAGGAARWRTGAFWSKRPPDGAGRSGPGPR